MGNEFLARSLGIALKGYSVLVPENGNSNAVQKGFLG